MQNGADAISSSFAHARDDSHFLKFEDGGCSEYA